MSSSSSSSSFSSPRTSISRDTRATSAPSLNNGDINGHYPPTYPVVNPSAHYRDYLTRPGLSAPRAFINSLRAHRGIEWHEQSWMPDSLHEGVVRMLSFAWVSRFPVLQRESPAEGCVGVLDNLIKKISGKVSVVDFCSGGGGPIASIEKLLNRNRRHPIKFLLSDLYPHNDLWSRSCAKSDNLDYVDVPVDATRAPKDLARRGEGDADKHIRTFFLAFHHFDETSAKRVLEDAIENADGIGIFELQNFDLGSLFTITMLWPLTWLVTPFLQPTWTTLLFTYLIPIIPFVLVVDGYVSSWRTRSFDHVKHLVAQAEQQLRMDGKTPPTWTWEHGSRTHTWPGGKMYWITGRKTSSG